MPFPCPHCGVPIDDATIAAEGAKFMRKKSRGNHTGAGGRPTKSGAPAGGGERCGCKRQPLARAKRRGKSSTEHNPGCEFYAE